MIPNQRAGHPTSQMYPGSSRNSNPFMHNTRPRDRLISPAKRPLPADNPRSHAKSYLALVYNPASGEVKQQTSPDLSHFKHKLLDVVSDELCRHIQNKRLRITREGSLPVLHPERSEPRHDDQANMLEDAMSLDDFVKHSQCELLPLESARLTKPRLPKSRKMKCKPILPSDDSVMPNVSFTSDVEQTPIADDEVFNRRVSDKEAWEKWLCDAFRTIQQLGCRTMAKEWIKIIHPKKQTTNPYNGKKLKTGEGNPEDTKPPYWPKDVVHREPDHINKEDRTKLLLHLLMNTPHDVMCPPPGPGEEKKQIWAADLIATLEGKYDDKKHGLQGRREIIKHVLHVRQTLEVLENEYLEPSTELQVPDYATFRKPHLIDGGEAIDATSADDVDDKLETTPPPRDYDDGDTTVLTPSSDRDDPMDSGMPVFSEQLQQSTKKAEPRSKIKRAPRHPDDGQQSLSFTASTSSMGQNAMLPASFSSDQMAHPPHIGAPTHDNRSAVWNNSMPPSSNSLTQYPYIQFAPPEPGSAHSQTQFSVDAFQPMIPHAHFENMPEACYPQNAYYALPYTEGPNSQQGYQHAAYDYFAS